MMKIAIDCRMIGSGAETLAAAYIEENGMKLLARNFHFGREEIDLIARDGGTLVFIEVKYRFDTRRGLPAEAVNKTKQRSIARAAVYYMKTNGLLNSRVRFDVAAVLGDEITYIKNAFDTTSMRL